MLTQTRHKLLIDGAFVDGEGESFEVVNPGTEDVLCTIAGASAGQAEAAIVAARRAFASGCWSGLPAGERAGMLRRFVAYLASQRDRLTELAVSEIGCPISSGTIFAHVGGPLAHAAEVIEMFLKLPEIEENPLPFGERINYRGGAVQSIRRYLPVGVVAAISAYNAPFYINVWKVLPALIAGNTLVLRPSPLAPLTALIFGEAADAAGLPAGVLNVIAEAGAEGAVLLSTHKDVDMVAFTGSSAVGRQIMAQAAPTMKRLQLELGGKSAQIYLPDSLDMAKMAAAQVCLGGAGQGCVHGTRIFVPEASKAEAIAAMVAGLASVAMGDPADAKTTMGPVISAAQRDRCQRFVDLAVAAGATVAHGGKRPAHLDKGYFFEPTILDTPDNSNPAAQEEVFGPVVSVIGYRDLDHAVEMANDSVYGLSGWIYGRDTKQAVAVASRISTGTVNVNGGVFSAYSSSGGWRSSGLGRERGIEGLRLYQQLQVLNAQSA
jgi:aldehyde dehydrogenase (NAD+)